MVSEFKNLLTVVFDVNFIKTISENKGRLKAFAEDLLPSYEASDVFHGYPAFEIAQFREAGAFEFSSLYLSDNGFGICGVEEEVKALNFASGKDSAFLLVNRQVLEAVINQPGFKGLLVLVLCNSHGGQDY